jgi:hypothetical protein
MVDRRVGTDAAHGQALQLVARSDLDAGIADLHELQRAAVVVGGGAAVERARRAFDDVLAIGRAAATPLLQSEMGARPRRMIPPHSPWLESVTVPARFSNAVKMIGRAAVPTALMRDPRLTARYDVLPCATTTVPA